MADNVPKRPIDRLIDFMNPLMPIDVDLMVYTTEEILGITKEERKIIGEIVKYNKLLVGDMAVLTDIKRHFKAKC